MLDAYSIRKAVPRLLIAVIGINLSIYLCVGAIDLTNIIGRGLVQLISDPFIDANTFKAINVEGNAENDILGVLGTGAVLGGALAAIFGGVLSSAIAVIGMLLPLIITISMIALAVLFTLVLRTGLLVFLTIVSPIAIACFVLPGTEKYFQKWMDLFGRTLMVYPIIAAIFAVSNVMAAILLNSASTGGGTIFSDAPIFAQAAQSDAINTIQLLAAVLVLYAPLVLIPFAFKIAGGAISAVMNAASGRAGNIAGRVGQRIQKNREDPNTFLGYNKNKAFQNRERRGLTAGSITSGTMGAIRGVRSGRGALSGYQSGMRAHRGRNTFDAASQFMENDQVFQAIKGDDDKMWALMEGKTDADMRRILHRQGKGRFGAEDSQEMNDAVAELMQLRARGGDSVVRMAATRAQAGTGTGFEDSGEMLNSINTVAGTDRSTAGRMLAEMRGSAMKSERVDLGGAGFTDSAIALDKLYNADATKNSPNPVQYTEAQATHDLNQSLLRGNAAQAVAGRIQSIEQIAPTLKGNADAVMRSETEMRDVVDARGNVQYNNDGTKKQYKYEAGKMAARELATLANRYDAASQISPQNAQEFANQVLDQEVDLGKMSSEVQQVFVKQGLLTADDTGKLHPGQKLTYQKAIEGMRSNEDFLTMRREYSAGRLEAATNEAAAAANRPPGEGPPPILPPL